MVTEQKIKSAFLNPRNILQKAGVAYGSTVADLGCGGGYFVLDAARIIGDDSTVYGVDVLKGVLSALNSKARMYGLTNVKTVWSDAEVYGGARDIPNGSVDTVLLVQLLSESPKHDAIFKETVRMMKQQGRAVVVEWKRDANDFGPPPEKCVDPEHVKQVARAEGLKLVQEIDAGQYHYGLIFGQA